MDTSTLIQEHSWRVALLVFFLSWIVHRFADALTAARDGASGMGTNSCCLLLLLGASGVVILNWIRREAAFILLRKELPPGKLGFPVVGTIPHLLLDTGSYMPNTAKRFGDIFTDNGLVFSVVTTREEAIAWLWNTERKGCTVADWPFAIRQLLGKGAIANTNGKRHRALRKIMEPAFTPQATRDYLEVIDGVTRKTLQEWSAGPPTEDCGDDKQQMFHPSEEFKSFSLRLFFVAAFGKEGDPQMVDQLHTDFKLWIDGFGSLIPYRIPGTQFYKSMAARDRILDLCEQIVNRFKAENPGGSGRAKTTMMGRACYGVDEEGKPMALDDLKDNILNMVSDVVNCAALEATGRCASRLSCRSLQVTTQPTLQWERQSTTYANIPKSTRLYTRKRNHSRNPLTLMS